MNSYRHCLSSFLLRLRLRGLFLIGLMVFGCSGSQGPATTVETADTDTTCVGCSPVEVELKQAAIASIDPALNVTSVRFQMDNDKATAMFGVEYKGVPIAGLSLRTRQGNPLATSQVEFSEEAKEVSETPSLNVEAAGARALEVQGGDARALDAQLIFLPTTKAVITATDAIVQIEALRLAWFVRVQNSTEPGSFPEIFYIYLDAQDGSSVESRQEVSYELAEGHSFYSGKVSVNVSDDPSGKYRYALVDETRGGRQTYSQGDMAVNGGLAIVGSDILEFGDHIIAATFGEAYANDEVTVHGQTMAVDLHYGIGQTWDFFREVFHRDGPYNNGTPVDGVANVIPAQGAPAGATAAYVHSVKKIYVFLPGGVAIQNFKGGHPEYISHELAHAVINTELAPPVALPPTGNAALEFSALNESLAQIFSLVEKNWRANGLEDQAVPIWDAENGWGWAPSSSDGGPDTSLNYYCEVVSGACPKTVSTVWTEKGQFPGSYIVGGLVRQLFWYLSAGVSPVSNPNLYGPGSGLSSFLPLDRGFPKLGMKKATYLFYNAIQYSGVAYPDLHTFGNMLVQRAIDEDGECSEKHKTVVDALVAVNLLQKISDRDLPSVEVVVRQHNTLVDVTVDAFDPPGDSPSAVHSIERATVTVDGAVVDQVSLDAAGHGVVHLPLSLFQGPDGATHTIEVEVEDQCKNIATKSVTRQIFLNRNLLISQSGPLKYPTLSASLSDIAGELVSVQFLRGLDYSTVMGPAFSKYYDTSTWADGNHTIIISGTDTLGNVFDTYYTLVADNTPPTAISLAATPASAPPFLLTATATDAHPLVKAEFFVDTVALLSVDTTLPFNASYVPQDAGNHTLLVRVTDSYGNYGNSYALSAPHDFAAPVGTLNASQSGASVTLSANATDTCGFASMAVAVTGTSAGTSTFNAPIANPQDTSLAWTVVLATSFLAPGTHLMSVDVTDRCGNTTHLERYFNVVLSAPTVVVDAPVVPSLHPKLPTITVRVVHDRPIQSIILQRQIILGGIPLFQSFETWAPPGGAGTNPIHTFQLNTSGVDWTISGNLEIRAIVFDDLNVPGNGTTHLVVDNEAPALSEACTFLPAAVTCVVTGADSTVNGDNMARLQAAQFPFSYVTRIASPWEITVTGSGVGDELIHFTAVAKDKFGNEYFRYWTFAQSCQYSSQSNLWSCVYGPLSIVNETVTIKREP